MSETQIHDDVHDDGYPAEIMTEPDRPEPPRARPRKDRGEPAARSVVSEMERDDQITLRAWMDSFASDTPMRCVIVREKPRVGPNGENLGGTLETVTEKFDEEYLSEMHGGGTYLLKVQKQDARGSFIFWRSRTVHIAGEPKRNGQVLEKASGHPAAGSDTPMAQIALGVLKDDARTSRERADRLEREQRERDRERAGGLDVDALRAITEPLHAQLRAAQEAAAAAQQAALQAAATPPPRDEFRDRMMERMLDGESARIAALRTQFESEMRQRDEHHRAEISRLNDRHDREVAAMEKRHERDLEMTSRMHGSEGRARDIATEARLEAMKAENDRLNRELAEARGRIGALELKKDQSISDKIDEINKLKELVGDGDGGDAPAWYEKVVGALGSTPAIVGLLDKIGGNGGQGSPPAQIGGMPAQRALPPPGQPFQGEDGNVYVRDGAGNVRQIDPNVVRQRLALAAARKRRRAEAAEPPPPGGEAGEAAAVAEAAGVMPPAPPMRKPAASEVGMAVKFMESAIQNGTAPEAFAATARSMIPTDILVYIQHVGIDEFLNKVAVLEPGSPLTTQRGRNFARAVARVLLTGSADAPDAE